MSFKFVNSVFKSNNIFFYFSEEFIYFVTYSSKKCHFVFHFLWPMFDFGLIFGSINDKFDALFGKYITLQIVYASLTLMRWFMSCSRIHKKKYVWGVFLRHDMPFIKIFQSDPTCIIILVGENDRRR